MCNTLSIVSAQGLLILEKELVMYLPCVNQTIAIWPHLFGILFYFYYNIAFRINYQIEVVIALSIVSVQGLLILEKELVMYLPCCCNKFLSHSSYLENKIKF